MVMYKIDIRGGGGLGGLQKLYTMDELQKVSTVNFSENDF